MIDSLRHRAARFLAPAIVLLSLPCAAQLQQQDDLLPPDVAFVPSCYALSAALFTVHFDIAQDYYLYLHAFEFTSPDPGVELGEPQIPTGKKKHDEFFGEVETYRQSVRIGLPVRFEGEPPESVALEVTSQGCADVGVCYPPQTQQVNILTVAGPSDGNGASAGRSAAQPPETATTPADLNAAPQQQPAVSEQDRIADSLRGGASVLTLLTFFGFGLLLAFTPCVFPMIPILSGIIIGQGQSITTRKAFVLSVVYVLAMALTYTVAGVIVGLSGENVQALFQNPWVLGVFAGIFVLLSLSMFGFYELQMPGAVQDRLSAVSNKQQSGTLVGAGVMGFLSALIVGPCVTAPLIGALIYIAQTGDAVLGGAALFALSLDMGLPLIVIGTSAGKLMPRAGPWMNAVKALFGVLLLAVAVWLLSRVLPASVTMALYAALLIVSAIYMGALEPVSPERSGWYRLWKGIGLILLLYGALLIIGAAAGGGNMMQPLKGLSGGAGGEAAAEHDVTFRQIKGLEGLKQALAEADRNNQPVMLDLYADWCVSCHEMENFTFPDAGVQSALEPFMLIQADVTPNDARDKALLKHLGVFGPPAIVFYGPDGEEVPGYRVVGYKPAGEFAAHVQQVRAAID
jgi:thiol:disulfide interchange protein DsbD